MNDKNRILLVLDGSEASLHATQFAIRYARATKMEVVAQLVIDSGNLWKTIGSCTSGLIGSGPYVAAYEGAKKDLLEIAGFIEQSFSARADAAGIKTEFHIDEGEPLHEIDKRAADCSLIIVGDLAVSKSMIESSTGERLANRSPLPTLLIRQPIDDLKVAQFYVDSNCYEPGAMAHFIELTEALNLERHIICVGNAGGMDRFVQKIRNDASERVKLHVAVRVVS
ncbi:MAG TPA: universal stress protein, partial [Chroococcales cyanobacterium]